AKLPVGALQPLYCLVASFRRGPVLHRLEDLLNAAHAVLLLLGLRVGRRTPGPCSSEWMANAGRAATGNAMLELPLDVPQQARRAETEQLRPQPLVPQLLFDHDEPGNCFPGGTDPTCRLQSHLVAAALLVVPDRPGHGETHREGGVNRLLAGRGLDEVGTGH